MEPIRRVNVDFTATMLQELDGAAQELNVRRHAIIRTLLRQALDQHSGSSAGLDDARLSEIGSVARLATGLEKDVTAVPAAVETKWSDGQVEGQINRLKMLKRQMYGRAGFALPRAPRSTLRTATSRGAQGLVS